MLSLTCQIYLFLDKKCCS